jgi:hypothetical protein
MNARYLRIFIAILICICAGCASIQPPSGGKKDVTPPRLLSIIPADSLLNTKVSRIQLRFDEYVTVTDAGKEVQISPILPIAPTVTGMGKKVTVKIADTLLEDNTTYRISFGSAIKDLHEGNVFPRYSYTFSTGGYFDSLQVSGNVIIAATGMVDTGDVYVMLYYASRSDSAIVREKPKYIIKTDRSGNFSLKGLPARKFRIYALKDANSNLIYDGGTELIGFYDGIVQPGDSALKPITLKVFREIDTFAATRANDTASLLKKGRIGSSKNIAKEGLTYTVPLDTADVRKRTFDINLPIILTFNKVFGAIAESRIHLDYDSAGVKMEAPIAVTIDTAAHKNMVRINNPAWLQNTVYTLRLQKGFAKDTAGADVLPSRYTFRTKRDEDYGTLQIHMPTHYAGKQYLLVVFTDADTIYKKPVMDTIINLVRLKPATYNFRLIIDKNENGKWDTGDLFNKIQPEDVIPYGNTILLKPNWSNIVDFEQKRKTRPGTVPERITPK